MFQNLILSSSQNYHTLSNINFEVLLNIIGISISAGGSDWFPLSSLCMAPSGDVIASCLDQGTIGTECADITQRWCRLMVIAW